LIQANSLVHFLDTNQNKQNAGWLSNQSSSIKLHWC